MATDFNEYRNLRLIWHQPAAITNLRDGLPAPGDPVIIEAFLKASEPTAQELPSLRIGVRTLSGFICRWALLPAGGDWLSAGNGWSWDESGLMPAGLQADARGNAYLGDLPALPTLGGLRGEATITSLGGTFGVGGIGAELRVALGDAIRVAFETVS